MYCKSGKQNKIKRNWYCLLLFWSYNEWQRFYNKDILLDQRSYKTYENILIYDISYKSFMGAKPLGTRFDEIDRFIKIYDRITSYYYLTISGLIKFVIGLNIL